MAERRTPSSRCPNFRKADGCLLKQDGTDCFKTLATDSIITSCMLQLGGLDTNPIKVRYPQQIIYEE